MDSGHTPTPGTIGPWLIPYLAGSNAMFLTGEESLRLRSFNAAAGVTLALEGRLLTPTGEIVPISAPAPTTTDRAAQTLTAAVGAGWLLHLSVRASAGSPRVGQCFVVVEIVRGQAGALQPLGVLLQGYVTDTSGLAWPGTPIRPSADGPGVIRSILGTDPAAGAEWSETVPTNARWRLLGVEATFVADITVANREAILVIDDGASVVAEVASGLAQTASQTRRYSFARGVQRFALQAAPLMSAPVPDAILMGGYRVRSSTFGIQAGDNWSAPQLWVEEWIED